MGEWFNLKFQISNPECPISYEINVAKGSIDVKNYL
jgi:hypothetical protein